VPWASIASGWQNSTGNVPAQCRFLNAVTIQVVGTLAVTSNASSAIGNITIGNLPSGYFPSQAFNSSYGIDGLAGTGYFLNIRTDGSIHLYGLPALTTSEPVGINAIIAQDA